MKVKRYEADNIELGASLSSKVCRAYDIDIKKVLYAAQSDLGISRFRLMTYWDECEPQPGLYNFDSVDELVGMVQARGGTVSLCLGLRQPRWPECHRPEWAKSLNSNQLQKQLLKFIEATVVRYRSSPAVVEYQLENEALNKGIGTCDDYSRQRLKLEYQLVKRLDSTRPVIMSTTNSWGLPLLGPIPDVVGFSMYRHQWGRTGLSRRHRSTQFVRARAWTIKRILKRPVFCHELQMEPWGPMATELLSNSLQLKLMNPALINDAYYYAVDSKMKIIDMWGLEWWYWRMHFGDDESCWSEVKKIATNLATK